MQKKTLDCKKTTWIHRKKHMNCKKKTLDHRKKHMHHMKKQHIKISVRDRAECQINAEALKQVTEAS